MNKIFIFIGGLLGLAAAAAGILYMGEMEKNRLLRQENLKTVEESQAEIRRITEEVKQERNKLAEDRKKVLNQVSETSKEKEDALKEAEALKKRIYEERELSLVANDDLDKLRNEVAKLRTEGRQSIAHLEESFQKKKQAYETRVLSLEARLAKTKEKLDSNAERYHYNLGVVYTQNKDYDLAVEEFKIALGYNPKNAQAHYNLGIIYDDYFKDKENARYHYRCFLELSPTSDDAESVREWLKDLDR